jgi:transglutaminase/protease-like cytokinesis protein 3
LSGNIYNQIKQVHDFLVDYIKYDSESNSEISHSVYGALINKLAVCDGYAKAFKYILDDMGISCVEVCGTGQNSSGATENHAWNDVLINGKWYAVDVTWDDPIIIGGNGRLTDDLRYRYFLKGANDFYQAHQEDGYIVSNGKFEYPVLSNVNY